MPTTAQTARIAYLSHAGSGTMLASDEERDNFGIIPRVREYASRNRYDSIVRISDTTAIGYGEQMSKRVIKYSTRAEPALYKRAGKAAKMLQQVYPTSKFIGFDTTTAGPKLKGHKAKRNGEAPVLLVVTPLGPPQHPGVLIGVALILGLSALGWLLGERPLQLQKEAG